MLSQCSDHTGRSTRGYGHRFSEARQKTHSDVRGYFTEMKYKNYCRCCQQRDPKRLEERVFFGDQRVFSPIENRVSRDQIALNYVLYIIACQRRSRTASRTLNRVLEKKKKNIIHTHSK